LDDDSPIETYLASTLYRFIVYCTCICIEEKAETVGADILCGGLHRAVQP